MLLLSQHLIEENKEQHMISRTDILKEVGTAVTKLKKVQKENELLRDQADMLQREADYWEAQYKALDIQYIKRSEEINTLTAEVKLWKGTGL
jgi:cytochrome c556